ncbi:MULTISPECIES: hypothetical protein [Shimia]|uniref:Uncharacterized protein n=1 Tax=Shimia marina TaxID=321267 RepID=A0A0P1ETV3_9RHOB|nr:MULTISPECIES: hypothetical protein [Shimia]CUH54021.1 hypothetical protein SHM7688_03490 [Shimia marina]SFE16651.1 hypothetical protein SAMN04488037_10621 [Shimia marina]
MHRFAATMDAALTPHDPPGLWAPLSSGLAVSAGLTFLIWNLQ